MNKIGSIACLGPANTHSDIVSRSYFSDSKPIVNLAPNICAVFAMVAMEDGVDSGLVPFQNLLEGDVNATLDALRDFPGVKIVAEHCAPIHHCLIGRKELDEDNLDRRFSVYSHPQALAQTSRYFAGIEVANSTRFSFFDTNSTAEAVRIVAANRCSDFLAVGTREAALDHGLKIIDENIEDDPDNETLFLEIRKEDGGLPMCERSYFLFRPENVPNQLGAICSVFGEIGVNITFVQSRPTRKAIDDSIIFLRAGVSRQGKLFSSLKRKLDSLKIPYRVLSS